MDSNELTDLLGKLGKAGIELRDLIREANGATKDLRHAIREAEQFANRNWNAAVDEKLGAAISEGLDDLGRRFNQAVSLAAESAEKIVIRRLRIVMETALGEEGSREDWRPILAACLALKESRPDDVTAEQMIKDIHELINLGLTLRKLAD